MTEIKNKTKNICQCYVMVSVFDLNTYRHYCMLMFALCSNTFVTIQASTNLVWKMQRYHLVREFHSKPFLVPPLILFAHVFILIRYMCRRSGHFHRDFSKFGFRE